MKKIFFVLIVAFLLSSICLAGEWNLTESLNLSRSEFCSVTLDDGRVLVAGGYASCEATNSCEIFDPNIESWTETESMNHNRHYFSLTKMTDGRILAIGGDGLSGEYSGITSEIFNPQTETWDNVSVLNFYRASHDAVLLLNGDVLVVGGDYDNNYTGCEIYSPIDNQWSLTGFCTYPKVDHTLELLSNGSVMAIAGGNSIFNKVELYDINAETWSELATLSDHRKKHTSHLLPDGNILVIGGSGYNGSPEFLSSCEIYTEIWTFADSLEIGRTNHCSEKLLNNKILAIGGQGETGSGSGYSCEILDILTGQWQSEASMNHTRSNFISEILDNEQVLVTGGNSFPVPSEIYTWNYQPIVSQPQTLNGLNEALVGDILTFSVTASDPDEDSVSVRIDWGDNETSEWTELQPSGTTFELSHAWTEPGQYEVCAQTADQWYFLNELCHNSLSEWGDTLLVTINGQAVEPSIELMSKMSAYPNPFDKSTTVCFYGAVNSHENARIEIYNIKGQKIRTLENLESAGLSPKDNKDRFGYSITWNGRDDKNRSVTSGIYFYKLMMGEKEIASNKMLLFK